MKGAVMSPGGADQHPPAAGPWSTLCVLWGKLRTREKGCVERSITRRAEDNRESLNDIESQNKLAIVLRMEKKVLIIMKAEKFHKYFCFVLGNSQIM